MAVAIIMMLVIVVVMAVVGNVGVRPHRCPSRRTSLAGLRRLAIVWNVLLLAAASTRPLVGFGVSDGLQVRV